MRLTVSLMGAINVRLEKVMENEKNPTPVSSSVGPMRPAGCLHRHKNDGLEAWWWYDGDPSELSPDVYDIRPMYELDRVSTPTEKFAKWLEDGPKLAKAARLCVGIKVSALSATATEGE